MSVRIPCPHCGVRNVEEFVYGEVLDVPGSVVGPDAVAFDRAFMHNNIEGPVTEAWFHLYGCRRWVHLDRDTRSDEIVE